MGDLGRVLNHLCRFLLSRASDFRVLSIGVVDDRLQPLRPRFLRPVVLSVWHVLRDSDA